VAAWIVERLSVCADDAICLGYYTGELPSGIPAAGSIVYMILYTDLAFLAGNFVPVIDIVRFMI